MDLLGIILAAIDHVITVFSHAYLAGMTIAEDGLRVPLQHIGVVGAAQTMTVAMVPLLTLIAAVRLLRGVIRAVVVLLLIAFTIHALWPLISLGTLWVREKI